MKRGGVSGSISSGGNSAGSQSSDAPVIVTELGNFRSTAKAAPDGARVPVEVRVRVKDPFIAYRRARDNTGGIYFETTGGQEGWGYFGVRPAYWHEIDQPTRNEDEMTSFNSLETLLDSETLVRGDCDVPYPCGAFGWISYDVVREIEDLPDTTVDDRGLPRVQFGIYDCVAAWKEPWAENATLRITACPRIESGSSIERVYRKAKHSALNLALRVRTGDSEVDAPDYSMEMAEFTNECGRDEYVKRVKTVKEYIRDGDTFQANISQRLSAPAIVHPVEVFGALREVNPAPYSALIEFPGVDLLSASPELLLEVHGDHLLTEPIAGTRRRGDNSEEEQRLRDDLLSSEKEHAEHAMLVDLERNDLGKVSEYGSVDVTDYRRIDSYSEVIHTVSTVESKLRNDASMVDAIAAVFPGGTITGAPKPRTMEIIDEVESRRRGPYTGSIGVLGFDHRSTMNMTIRTLTHYADQYYLRVGAGIVHDSIPEAEFVETLDKGRALINAVDEALDTDQKLITGDWPAREDDLGY